MAQLTDKTLSERMLEAREQGGYKILPYVRMNARAYAWLGVIYGGLLIFLAVADSWGVFALIVGVILGTLLRDVSWLVGVQQTWPFVMKVTDWDKVKRAADGEPFAEPGRSTTVTR